MKTTVINSRLRLSEYTEGIRFGTDALLLAAFVSGSARKDVSISAREAASSRCFCFPPANAAVRAA